MATTTTTWALRPNFDEPRTWLLDNGEIIGESLLEESGSGRKVRIAGTNITAFTRDIKDLIYKGVALQAKQKKTAVLMPFSKINEHMVSQIGYRPEDTRAELYVLNKDRNARTKLWWKFKHPTLPIEAVLQVNIGRVSRISPTHDMTTRVVTPPIMRTTAPIMEAPVVTEDHGEFPHLVGLLSGRDHEVAREFVTKNAPPGWSPQHILGRATFDNERKAIEALLEKLRVCEDLEAITLPDLRNPAKPTWFRLKLIESNVTSGFLSDLTEYLEGSPTIDRALELYDQLRECLLDLGLVMAAKTEDDFRAGLLGNDPAGVTVPLNKPHEEGGGEDDKHTLSMDLRTGTFIVNCSVEINHDEIAESWQRAKMFASVTGEEDTLMAYAREAARQGHDKRSRRIIKERRAAKQ